MLCPLCIWTSPVLQAEKHLQDAKKNASTAIQKDRATILDQAEKQSKQHKVNALNHYQMAEKNAIGDEHLALQMQLAQNFRNNHDYQQCVVYYNRVAENTDQQGLKYVALWQASRCQKKMESGAGEPLVS